MDIPKLLSLVPRRDTIPLVLYALGAKRICEVGVREGKFLRQLAKAEPEFLCGVDIWRDTGILGQNGIKLPQHKLDRFYKEVSEWATAQSYDAQIIRDFSVDAAKTFEDDFFDFVYIDADHTYEAVKLDLESWWPKVKPGGILSGHDYKHNTNGNGLVFGVVEAVDEFASSHNLKLHFTRGGWKSYFLIRD